MVEKNVEPLLSLIQKSSNKQISKENIYPYNINSFFIYLKNEKITQEDKSLTLDEFCIKLKYNRYICEFFSTYEEESIYLFLFKLYLSDSTKDILKKSILKLIEVLRINIEANKNVYDYLFQELASIYRKEENISNKKFTLYLTLLNSILGETENILKPRNYFSCFGNCKFELNIDRRIKLEIGYVLTFIINFKIGTFLENEKGDNEIISNILKIEFSNGYKIDSDLKYPFFLIVKKIQNSFLKTFPNDEWINLIINIITLDKNPTLYFFVNGENRLTPFKLPPNSITNEDYIKSITFFNNFYGEVGSIVMLSHRQKSLSSLNSSEFLLFFK